ncbi:MAG TPA: hypothetical protein VK115_04145 [Staphylococcus sp.]|nr:hypothetical protein [Staphylococcus sp.]
MIQITPEQVEVYLKIINDQNPLHQYIVPGQMVVQLALRNKKVEWQSYKVNYIAPVEVYEMLQFEHTESEQLHVKNKENEIKILVYRI